MKTIFKYPLHNGPGQQTLMLPRDAEIIHVGEQGPQHSIFIWARVDPENSPLDVRYFFIEMTGQRLPFEHGCVDQHLGTVQIKFDVDTQLDELVLHVFERTRG